MTAKENIIALAEAELGYHEKWQNAGLDDKTAYSGSGNYTKYARDLDSIPNFYNGKKNGYAWCDMFVDWLFVHSFGAETALKILHQPWGSAGAGCTYSLDYYRRDGAFYSSPEPGDQIFFGSVGNSSHTGLVVAVTSDTVTTIEGNSSDAVRKRTLRRNDSSIAGYGRPLWGIVGDEVPATVPETAPIAPAEPSVSVSIADLPTCTVTLHELSQGTTGPEVEHMQQLLLWRGYSVGIDGADGEFGPNTFTALTTFQRDVGLTADGICGAVTWTVLLKGG